MTGNLLPIATTTFVFGLATSLARAQERPVGPHGEFVAHSVQSGDRPNKSESTRSVFKHVVTTPNAAWMRLYFSDLALEGRSTIRMTSLQDGEVQELDAAGALQWGNSSAYFNGDRVLVEILAAPQTEHNRVAIEQIAVEFAGSASQTDGAPDLCGICGADDRVPSTVNWSARLMPAGCTASVYNSCSTMVSAGHCASSGMVVQFNVPNSLSNCSLVNPPVADQFPITSFSHSYVDIGNDWSVLQPGTNSLGQRPYDRYSAMMAIASAAAGVGNSVGLWGYGMDTNCINNQRQQSSSGGVSVVAPTFFQFSADLRAGNSGTAVIRNGEIIGVVTNCMEGCPNVASAMSIPGFVAARNAMSACQVNPCPEDVTGDFEVSVPDLMTIIQNWGACPPSPCPEDIAPPGSNNNTVDAGDLITVINAWGTCP